MYFIQFWHGDCENSGGPHKLQNRWLPSNANDRPGNLPVSRWLGSGGNSRKSLHRVSLSPGNAIGRNRIMAVEWKSSSLAQKVFLHLSLLVAFLTAFGGRALAQSTAGLNGTVTDATGAVVPNAQVVATNQATG